MARALTTDIRGAREVIDKLRAAEANISYLAWLRSACVLVQRQAKQKHFRRGTRSRRLKEGAKARRRGKWAAPKKWTETGGNILTSRSGGRGLQGAITYRVVGRGRLFKGHVGVSKNNPAARYAKVHEGQDGKEVTTIKTKRRRYLVFQTHDGSWHAVKQVKIHSRSYLRSSLKEKDRDIRKLFGTRVGRALRKARLR